MGARCRPQINDSLSSRIEDSNNLSPSGSQVVAFMRIIIIVVI